MNFSIRRVLLSAPKANAEFISMLAGRRISALASSATHGSFCPGDIRLVVHTRDNYCRLMI